MINHRQRRRWGRYYTPHPVVDLCWEILRSRILPGYLRDYYVVDPAAGDGVFLQEACVQGWIKGERTLGVELHPGEAAGERLFRMVQGDGLIDCPDCGFMTGKFDLVVGNPPFGGEGLRGLCRKPEDPAVLEKLRQLFYNYELFRFRHRIQLPAERCFSEWLDGPEGKNSLDRLGKSPIELFFLERFIRLSREDGWCAVVLPEGLLANDRMQYYRDWVETTASLKAVVALPRGTFQREGAAARTALVILQRKPQRAGEAIYFAAPDYGKRPLEPREYFSQVASELKEKNTLATGSWIRSEQRDSGRWDPGFWHPKYRQVILALKSAPRLGEFIALLTYGPIRPGQRPELAEPGIPVIGQSEFTEAGLDLGRAIRVKPGSAFDPPRSRVHRGDLLFPRSGEGSLLRFKAGVYEDDSPANISCFVDLLRLEGVDPYYVWLVLKTRFLRKQILRLQNGVGTPNLNFQEIRDLRLPWLNREAQARWRSKYLKIVAPLHMERLREQDVRKRIMLGETADSAFRKLVTDLDAELTCRYLSGRVNTC